ncbi:MAG: hypothetical protein ATN34_05450 [Epulopiscium sp. Nele67-Bin002]|nr:MAG: hypothetical protein BEN18_02770 [Epulopiscium sp. Nuni2H_MBin001]OON91789.1 MAG: hypothetical protein ATN34_05450 [Epulopiscium sp. Nele67-Bin002]OON93412.1 MAG: hypothetical protein ATN33_05775 [Epulopiscium sp. Nele67-Bin001]
MNFSHIADILTKKILGWPENPVVPTFADLQFSSFEGEPLLLDLYLPTCSKAESYPVIIFIHGCGWLAGDNKLIEPGVFKFLDKGFAVASVSYTLTANAYWPIQGQQIKGAVRWLRSNAKAYNLDANRFVAYGGSSGGQLASFLGTTNGITEFDIPEFGDISISSAVQATIALYAVTNLVEEQPTFSSAMFTKFLGGKAAKNQDIAINASPIFHISKETTTPFLLMHGDKDTVVLPAQSIEFKHALEEEGIYCELYILDGVGHVAFEFNEEVAFIRMLTFINKILAI